MRRLAATLALTLLSVPSGALDWPGYLGPGRDGRSAETGLLDAWPEKGPEVLWRTGIGAGYSSVAVGGGGVFTMFADGGGEWLARYDPATGGEVWRLRLGRLYRSAEGAGPRATPLIDGGRVYGLSSGAVLVCADAVSGEEIWRLDLVDELGARIPQWGVSASPLVEGDLLLLPAGGSKGRSLVALDKADGRLIWSSGDDPPGYGSPIVVTISGIRQAIFFTAYAVVGAAVADGEILWRAPWRTAYDANAATPIFVPSNGVLVSSGYDTGAMLLQVVKEGGGFQTRGVWRNRVMRSHYNTSVRVGAHLYGYDESILKCVDVLTGEQVWRGRGGSKGSLLYADGHLFVLSGDGELRLVEATPLEFRIKGLARLTRERSWAVPALSAGVLYVRTWSELIAVRVAARATSISSSRRQGRGGSRPTAAA